MSGKDEPLVGRGDGSGGSAFAERAGQAGVSRPGVTWAHRAAVDRECIAGSHGARQGLTGAGSKVCREGCQAMGHRGGALVGENGGAFTLHS